MDVSFSQLHKYETCGAAYQFHYVRRLRAEEVSANLIFGKVLDKGMSEFIRGHALGEYVDPLPIFEQEWDRALSETIVDFSATQSPKDLRETGAELARQFPEFWDNSGLTALIGPGGEPMVQQKLTVQVAPGINLRCFLDVAVLTEEGESAIIDLKTALSPAPDAVLLLGEQLTDYQIAAEANKAKLGIESISQVGFIELLKRKIPKASQGRGPEIIGPSLTPARSEAVMAERRAKIDHLVTLIRKGVFFRNPGMAYNSPCSMCDFQNLCLHGDMEGLIEAPKGKAQAKLAVA
ncbi:PD-(D/E)XK nuclease family protein [Modicisalibacter sp. MOD 31.J]|uniref:RecB family exonuclease n=1 Tax=Modicisalibacter sp. MOD 31.J TaxID=2831897 RepID=UPI001CCE576E|nr:PD-(D/E)XK nuclease family protein [Modicisalibacter sp. MOD 31.J]MBZ9574531.1 PD-(D/E)XK nuclease family protein [Modicisalibacter sp. MOD 31.J]